MFLMSSTHCQRHVTMLGNIWPHHKVLCRHLYLSSHHPHCCHTAIVTIPDGDEDDALAPGDPFTPPPPCHALPLPHLIVTILRPHTVRTTAVPRPPPLTMGHPTCTPPHYSHAPALAAACHITPLPVPSIAIRIRQVMN